MSLSATISSPIVLRPEVRSEDRYFKHRKNVPSNPVGLKPLCVQFPFVRSITHAIRVKHASVICAAMSATQTETVTRQSSTITAAPIHGILQIARQKVGDIFRGFAKLKGVVVKSLVISAISILYAVGQNRKEKSPELDDGGAGLPPRDDGGGGGGGGGGGHWSGGFFLFGFLALLGLIRDEEGEGSYQEERRS
ncbi:hypothetical protein OROMI_023435 [Orobanche minor]